VSREALGGFCHYVRAGRWRGFRRASRGIDISVAGPAVAVSPVSHCDLRDFQGAAFVSPSEWRGPTVVVLDEGDDPVAEFVGRGELTAAQQAPLQDREEQLD
jgi:hypothetical protein